MLFITGKNKIIIIGFCDLIFLGKLDFHHYHPSTVIHKKEERFPKENVLKLIEDKNCVISTLEIENDFPFRKIEFNNENLLIGNSNIMTINDYVKMMVVSYQNKYPDTELSKKLGISRKSLWEKRKKLDIEKKK
jgi:hypothetical protein